MNSLTVIVLTKNNFDDLFQTVRSIESYCYDASVIIFDGSNSNLVKFSSHTFDLDSFRNDYVYHYKPDVQGIYPSMNAALELVRTSALIFLNSGDCFCASPSRCLDLVVNRNLNGVFASARVLYHGNLLYQHPFVGIKNINTWLNCWNQLPIHQAIVFNTSWALCNLYPVHLDISADNFIKKQLVLSGSFSFSSYCLVNFSYGGQSTANFSCFKNERAYISQSKLFRLRFKFLLQMLFKGFPVVSVMKNKFINFVCVFL